MKQFTWNACGVAFVADAEPVAEEEGDNQQTDENSVYETELEDAVEEGCDEEELAGLEDHIEELLGLG